MTYLYGCGIRVYREEEPLDMDVLYDKISGLVEQLQEQLMQQFDVEVTLDMNLRDNK